MTDEKDQATDASAALLGVPTGEESLSRDDVDELGFSTKQQKRPKGLSRAEYMRSGPGHDTQNFISLAGVTRRRSIGIAITATLVLASAGALIWYLVLRG